jgi:hypothetical protein
LLAREKDAHGRVIYHVGSEMLPLLQDLAGHLGAGSPLLVRGVPDPQESVKRTSGDSESKPKIPTISARLEEDLWDRPPDQWAALKLTLDEYQIIGKRRKDLIACEWVDAQYVRACVEFAKNEPANWDNPVGMAITRMLEHMAAPAFKKNGHMENCRCTECTMSKYVSGRYSDLLNQGREDDEAEDDPTGTRCLWMTDTGERLYPNVVGDDRTRELACENPCKQGSSHWCKEHYELGVATYGTGKIKESEEE